MQTFDAASFTLKTDIEKLHAWYYVGEQRCSENMGRSLRGYLNTGAGGYRINMQCLCTHLFFDFLWLSSLSTTPPHRPLSFTWKTPMPQASLNCFLHFRGKKKKRKIIKFLSLCVSECAWQVILLDKGPGGIILDWSVGSQWNVRAALAHGQMADLKIQVWWQRWELENVRHQA